MVSAASLIRLGWAVLVPVVAGWASLTAQAADPIDVFIRFRLPQPGAVPFKGGSTDRYFPGSNGWSVVTAISQGFFRPVDTAPINNNALTITKFIDDGSPALFQTCAAAGTYDSVQVVFRPRNLIKPDVPPISVAKFENVQITRVAAIGSSVSATEAITLAFTSWQWSYGIDDAFGADSVTVNWDFRLGLGGVGPLPGLSLGPAALPTGAVGLAYTQTVSATGGTPPYRYRIQNGLPPHGVFLNSVSGTLTGTPTTAGQYAFRVVAMDDNYCFIERAYTLTIVETCALEPRITSITIAGTTLRVRLQGTAGCSYQWRIASVPAGPWIKLGNPVVAPAGGMIELTDPLRTGNRFFRASAEP